MASTRSSEGPLRGLLAAAGIRSALQAGRRVASLFAVVLLVRRTGVDVTGAVFLSIAVATVIAPVVNRGLSQSLLRMVPALDPDDGRAQVAMFVAARRRVLSGAVAATLLAVVLERLLSPSGPMIWSFGAAMGGAVALADLGASYLRALNRRARPEIIEALVPALFLIGIFFVDPALLQVTAVLWWRFVLEGSVALILVVAPGIRLGRDRARGRQLEGLSGYREYGPLWLTMLAWLALGQLDVLFLGFTRDPTAVGLYVPILRTCELLVFPYVVLNPYITSISARARSHLQDATVADLYERTVPISMLLVAPLAGALLAQPQAIMKLVYGISDPRLPGIVRILVVGLLVFMWMGPAPAVAYGIGNGRDISRAALQVIFSMIVATSVGVLVAGIVGAALATAVSFAVMGFATRSVVRRAGVTIPLARLALLPAVVVLVGWSGGAMTSGSSIYGAVVAAVATTAAAATTHLLLRALGSGIR